MKIHLGIMLLAAAACSGGSSDSGLDKSKKVNALSAGDVQTFCRWALAEEGGPGHETMCDDGLTFMVESEMDCESRYGQVTPGCTATIGDAEDCIHAIAADPCSFGGSACQPLLACSPGAPAFARSAGR